MPLPDLETDGMIVWWAAPCYARPQMLNWTSWNPMRIIRGRKAVVTGAASGIGKAIALALAAEGADLFLIDVKSEELQLVAREATRHGVAVLTAVCDLAAPAEITMAIARVRTEWDHVNILINCAGVACYGPLHLTGEDALRYTMSVNLLAPMQIVHQLLSALLAAEQAHILNVCSFFGLVPWKKAPIYQASKYGLLGFTLALRSDYYRVNFGVTALCPGYVRTAMLTDLKDPEAHRPRPIAPAFFSTTPTAVAAAAIRAIKHDRGLVIVTPFARMAWWMMRLCPSLVDWLNREGWRRRHRIELPARAGPNE